MKITTIPLAPLPAAARHHEYGASLGFSPQEIGELQAALAGSALLDSWLEAPSIAPFGVIAPAGSADGPLPMRKTSSRT